MEGNVESEEGQGVIPRSVLAIFERLQKGNYSKSSVKVLYYYSSDNSTKMNKL